MIIAVPHNGFQILILSILNLISFGSSKFNSSIGDLVLFENIFLGLSEGQRVGLIAKNGSGKSTLLNILSGKEGYDSGTISFRRDVRVGYLEQDPQYPEELTVLEACFHHGNSTVELIKEYERCMETEGHPGLDEILVRMDQEKAWEYEQKAKQILSQLKIRDFNQQVKSLSGGQLKRVALANTLITEPDLLILDEPTNHLDLDMTEWLEDYLRRTNLTLLMVTHDRYFLDRVCSEIVEIDNRRIYQYKGNYSYYLEKREERIEAKTVEIICIALNLSGCAVCHRPEGTKRVTGKMLFMSWRRWPSSVSTTTM